MEQQAAVDTGQPKVIALPGTQTASTPWGKPEKRADAPAPPPVWTRYIDSRLKQFCAR